MHSMDRILLPRPPSRCCRTVAYLGFRKAYASRVCVCARKRVTPLAEGGSGVGRYTAVFVDTLKNLRPDAVSPNFQWAVAFEKAGSVHR